MARLRVASFIFSRGLVAAVLPMHPTSIHIPRGAIALLSLAAFASGMSLRVTDALLPKLASDFGISLGNASYVITLFSIAYGLSQLFFGPLGDRFGKYLVIAWACAACIVTASLCAMAPTFPMLMAARLLAGGTAAAIIPLSMAWIGDVVPYEQRQPILARFLVGQILGVSAGVFMGGFAADYLSWRTPFLGIASLFVMVSIALFALNRRLPEVARKTTRTEGNTVQRLVSEFRQVVARRWARVVMLSVFFEGTFVFGALAFIASHLHQKHGVSLSTAGSLVMLFGFGGLLFATSAALFVRRLGERGLARWGGICIGAALLTIAFAPDWRWAAAACFVAGLGFYMLHNTLQINATQMAPERRGAAVASFACCFFFGQSVGVGVAGMFIGLTGSAAIIAAGAVGTSAVGLAFSHLLASRP
jgi:predicted MFS family arabinose efflux permease